jgi:hypothetical protein
MKTAYLCAIVAAFLTLNCAAHVDSEDPSDPGPIVCEVTYRGEPCVFECTGCIEGVEEGFGSCEGALPTATDHCDYQRSNGAN